jgi:hypothetical protein
MNRFCQAGNRFLGSLKGLQIRAQVHLTAIYAVEQYYEREGTRPVVFVITILKGGWFL